MSGGGRQSRRNSCSGGKGGYEIVAIVENMEDGVKDDSELLMTHERIASEEFGTSSNPIIRS